ncbi:MAG: hypothetical protein V7L20_18475 [Nostoc sp.]
MMFLIQFWDFGSGNGYARRWQSLSKSWHRLIYSRKIWSLMHRFFA